VSWSLRNLKIPYRQKGGSGVRALFQKKKPTRDRLQSEKFESSTKHRCGTEPSVAPIQSLAERRCFCTHSDSLKQVTLIQRFSSCRSRSQDRPLDFCAATASSSNSFFDTREWIDAIYYNCVTFKRHAKTEP
ncbi:hypothetical protein Tcan_01432, partial [Toxocara canis]